MSEVITDVNAIREIYNTRRTGVKLIVFAFAMGLALGCYVGTKVCMWWYGF